MNNPITPAQQKAPDYYNPHNIVQDPQEVASLLVHEPSVPDPVEVLKKKYPVRIIVEVVILLVSVIAIPAALYLNQRPTRVFIEATATPTPTESPTPTPSPTPTETPK
jgi:hypothetical protein